MCTRSITINVLTYLAWSEKLVISDAWPSTGDFGERMQQAAARIANAPDETLPAMLARKNGSVCNRSVSHGKCFTLWIPHLHGLSRSSE